MILFSYIRTFIFSFVIIALVFGGFSFDIAYAQNAPTASPSSETSFRTDQNEQTSEATVKNIGVVAYLLSSFSAGILSWAASMIEVVLEIGSNVIDWPTVRTGWSIVLTIANLGFVLAILVIAFATMFRKQTYAMKATLWKLVIAALLVNFSLVIGGAVISFFDVFNQTFLRAITFDSLSNALANALQPQKIGAPVNTSSTTAYTSVASAFASPFAWIVSSVASVLFSLIFTALTVIVFLALLIMLFLRVLWLAILLIVSPIVWLAWIFPATQEYWEKWWKAFFRWNFFAPAALFFVYLTIATAANLPNGVNTPSEATEGWRQIFGNTGNHIAQLSLLLGILVLGIYVSNKFSLAGGSVAYGGAVSFRNWGGRVGARFLNKPLASDRAQGYLQNKKSQFEQTAKDRAASAKKASWWQPQRYFHRAAGGMAGLAGATAAGVAGLGRKYRGEQFRGSGEEKHKGPIASVWGGMQSEMGIFKQRKDKKKEKTENIQKELDRLYTRKTALQGERDLLSRVDPDKLTDTDRERLSSIDSSLTSVNKSIQDKEEQVGERKDKKIGKITPSPTRSSADSRIITPPGSGYGSDVVHNEQTNSGVVVNDRRRTS